MPSINWTSTATRHGLSTFICDGIMRHLLSSISGAADFQRVLLTVVPLKCTWFALASISCHLTAVNLRNGVGRVVCKLNAPFKRRSGVCQWSRFCVKALS